MTKYAGCKSLDAEIILDFVKGEINYDYSLNKFGNPYESNRSTVLSSEWKTTRPIDRLYCTFYLMILGFAAIPIAILIWLFTFLSIKGYLNNENTHYNYQKLLKWYWSNCKGVCEQTVIGKLDRTKIEFNIPANLWIEYELDGDYRDKIKTMSLVRHFVKRTFCGKISHIQRGWKVIFEFTEIPQYGYCILKYID